MSEKLLSCPGCGAPLRKVRCILCNDLVEPRYPPEIYAILNAARALVGYRKHNVLNFQIEKADDFIKAMGYALEEMESEK